MTTSGMSYHPVWSVRGEWGGVTTAPQPTPASRSEFFIIIIIIITIHHVTYVRYSL